VWGLLTQSYGTTNKENTKQMELNMEVSCKVSKIDGTDVNPIEIVKVPQVNEVIRKILVEPVEPLEVKHISIELGM